MSQELPAEVQINGRTLRLMQGDITTVQADAIVNAANTSLRGGGGVDGAIHRAGGPAILEECMRFPGCPTGEARMTTGGRLPARHVIHTVGPIWRGGNAAEDALLAAAYRSSLSLAEQFGLRTIAFPSISTGAYGFPIERAARIALRAALDHLRIGGSLDTITFVLFSAHDLEVYRQALAELTARR
jgi:O-acetyl-ADP-ribose deacetylase (regulator of RNase III)